jgi:hypothetical protein
VIVVDGLVRVPALDAADERLERIRLLVGALCAGAASEIVRDRLADE